MDTSCFSGGDISSSDCGDNEEAMAMYVEPTAGGAISELGASSPSTAPSSSRCRKSSRLKEKKEKKAQDPAAAGSDASSSSADAYNLRLSSLVKRVQVERRQSTPKQPKGKSKPPPLSKYRRRTANARERMRMKDINEGYESLRQCLPDLEQQGDEHGKKEKPTKFTILSLALNYIHALRDILGYPPVEGISVVECKSQDSAGVTATADNSKKNSAVNATATASSEESDLGSEVLPNQACSVSPPPPPPPSSSLSASSSTSPTVLVPCDDLCGNTSPASCSSSSSNFSTSAVSASSPELKEYSLAEEMVPLLSGVLHKDFTVRAPPHLSRCHDPLPGSSSMMDFRAEARSSPSSSVSDLSLSSPSPPPALELPEDCMDLDQSDLLDVSIPLAALDGMVEMVMS